MDLLSHQHPSPSLFSFSNPTTESRVRVESSVGLTHCCELLVVVKKNFQPVIHYHYQICAVLFLCKSSQEDGSKTPENYSYNNCNIVVSLRMARRGGKGRLGTTMTMIKYFNCTTIVADVQYLYNISAQPGLEMVEMKLAAWVHTIHCILRSKKDGIHLFIVAVNVKLAGCNKKKWMERFHMDLFYAKAGCVRI